MDDAKGKKMDVQYSVYSTVYSSNGCTVTNKLRTLTMELRRVQTLQAKGTIEEK